jgi:hypothetical protein
MVININMPYTELGWGSIDVADTVRITTYGYEALSKTDMRIRSCAAD